MTCIRFRDFLLFLLLHQVRSEEAELVFRAEGSVIEMGYCFGVDYIVVYRSSPGGDQLLGNSSNENLPHTPPADLQGRTRISQDINLLGLQITNLTHLDSGIYRRECWQNHTLVKQHTEQLSVCKEEIEAEEIIDYEEDGEAEILCNSTSIDLEGTSVRWYHEMYPSYRPTLFLDSSVSLEPLTTELQGVVKVRDGGALLVLNSNLLKNNLHFYCLVIKGTNCLSFQNIYSPYQSEIRDIFASQGDSVVLPCPADSNDQQWNTPLGRINDSSVSNNKMYISVGKKSEDFSLVIPDVSEEHRGDYSCITSLTELQYLLVLCPEKKSHVQIGYKGGNGILECSFDHDGSERVQWYRYETSGQHELIYDPQDKTVSIPKGLSGRLTLSESGSSLMISNLVMSDKGDYWCVVLKSQPFLSDNVDYRGDYDGDKDTEEDHYSDGGLWHDTETCISKQETTLTVLVKNLITPEDLKPGTNPTAEPLVASNNTVYAVIGGLVALLVVGAIVAVIVVKKRAKPSAAASRSGVHKNTDIQMDVDSGCTERLTQNDNV